MEKESELGNAVSLIKNDNLHEALEIINKYLLKDCIALIASRLKNRTNYEYFSLFYDNFLDFTEKIRNGKFKFTSDSALKSYFKTGCSHRAKEEINKDIKANDFLSMDIFEKSAGNIDDLYEAEKNLEYERVKNSLDIDLSQPEVDEALPMDVLKQFHSLNEKCKFLVVLKYMVNLSHKEIVDTLSSLYGLKNENVSKSELKRCLDHLRKNLY
jgi:hypothetical protein